MPFSFSNFNPVAILIMVLCLSFIELAKYARTHSRHSKKQVGSNSVGK